MKRPSQCHPQPRSKPPPSPAPTTGRNLPFFHFLFLQEVSFHDLVAHFFLALKIIPLSVWTTVYLPITY